MTNENGDLGSEEPGASGLATATAYGVETEGNQRSDPLPPHPVTGSKETCDRDTLDGLLEVNRMNWLTIGAQSDQIIALSDRIRELEEGLTILAHDHECGPHVFLEGKFVYFRDFASRLLTSTGEGK